MNKILPTLILLFIILPLSVLCKANSISADEIKDLKEQKINVFEMKRKLDDQQKHIINLTKEMNQVENNLGVQNKKYLKLSEERSKLEEAMNVQRKNVDLDSMNLKKNYSETKNVLMGILINKLEKTESPADMLAKKVLVQHLQSKLIDLESLIKSNKELQTSVDDLYKRLESSVQTEKNLVAVMNELEQRKISLRTTIESESNKKSESQNQFDELKNKMAMEKDSLKRIKKKSELAPIQITEEIKIPSKNDGNRTTSIALSNGFRAPLYLNQGIEYKQKGVTFKFQGKNEVLATKSGRIAYVGSLANYGNVVMIDHGNDTRTVLLGQFDSSVKNGDQVSDSQIIGYTNPRSVNGLGDGKIYFEVRKNNLAQNTYLLLDKKTIEKNSSN